MGQGQVPSFRRLFAVEKLGNAEERVDIAATTEERAALAEHLRLSFGTCGPRSGFAAGVVRREPAPVCGLPPTWYSRAWPRLSR